MRVDFDSAWCAPNQSCVSEKEKRLFRESRNEEKAAREVVSSEVCDSAGPDRIAGLMAQSDEDDVPLRVLAGKGSEVIDSSDNDEPLSVSLRRPKGFKGFKETGLLQSQKRKPGATTVGSSKPPQAFLTTSV